MKRRLRVLLALWLVPVVLLSNPDTAAAANPWHQVTVNPTIPLQDDDRLTCLINLQQSTDGTALNVGSKSACSGGVDTSPGWSQWGENGSGWALTVSGTDAATGASCGGNGGGSFGDAQGNTFTVGGTFGVTTIALGSTIGGCDVTEVCLFLFPDKFADVQTCTAVDVPAAVIDEIECVYGEPRGVDLKSFQRPHPTQSGIIQYWWEVTVSFSDASRYDLWKQTKHTSVSTSFNSDWSSNPISALGDTLVYNLSIGQVTAANEGQIAGKLAETKPTSIQVYALDGVRNTGTGYDASSGTFASQSNYPPSMPEGAYRGLTQPHMCRFYFGPKVLDIPNTDEDEPAGPLEYVNPPDGGDDEEPDVDSTPIVPEPIDTEPSFWSIVAGLLRLILGAIKAIGTAISNLAQLILDGLVGLFVPDTGVINSEFRDLEDEWHATTPARWVNVMDGMFDGAAVGCQGLPLDLSLPGGVEVHESIGAACSGHMANVAGIVRLVISAGLVIGGTIACVRAIGSGLGWDPGIRADT